MELDLSQMVNVTSLRVIAGRPRYDMGFNPDLNANHMVELIEGMAQMGWSFHVMDSYTRGGDEKRSCTFMNGRFGSFCEYGPTILIATCKAALAAYYAHVKEVKHMIRYELAGSEGSTYFECGTCESAPTRRGKCARCLAGEVRATGVGQVDAISAFMPTE